MKVTKIWMCLFAITALPVITARAQQDPLYGLYLNNPLLINPAYTGLNNRMTATINYRNQWAAFDGHPTTMAATGHVSLFDNRLGAGLTLLSDKVGEVKNTSVGGSFAYKISDDEKTFSFGMQVGAINYRTDPGSLSLQHPDDPSFTALNEMKFNLGAGAIYKTERYLIGLSVPRMISNSLKIQHGDLQVYQQHAYLMASYIHFVNERILFKPSVLLRGVKGAVHRGTRPPTGRTR